MLLQLGSTGPFTRQVCGGEIMSFPQGLDVLGQVSGPPQNSGAGVCFAKLVYVPLTNQEPGMQGGAIIFFLMQFIIYSHMLSGWKEDSRYLWKVWRLLAFIFTGFPAQQSAYGTSFSFWVASIFSFYG